MIKKLIVALAVVAMSQSASYGYGINWSSVNGYLNYSNGTVQLSGNLSSSLGCFVQLLWVGPNGIADSAYYGTGIDGHGGDDVVVDTAWVGAGGASGGDGWFDGQSVADGGSVSSGSVYFLRGWSAPASDFASGYVPASGTNRYFNSGLWTYNHINETGDFVDFTQAGGNLDTTLSPIPEPAMIGLGIIGLISLRLLRKRS